MPVWFSQGTTDKFVQPWWLKTSEIYSLTVLELTSLKSRCWQGHTPSEGSEGGPSLPPPASGGCIQVSPGLWWWNSTLCLLSTWMFSAHMCIFAYMSLLLEEASLLGVGSIPVSSSQPACICKDSVSK